MNFCKRAILYIARKWKKSLLLFLIIFSVSSLVLSGLAVMDAQEEQAAELRGTTGVSFHVSRNTSSGGWSSDANGSYSTQEFLSDEMIGNIAAVEGIKGYNASVKTILSLSDVNGNYLEQLNPIGHIEVDCQFYSFGCINSEYNSLFLSGALTMCDGSAIQSKMEDGIIISKEIANKHGLKVGDKIQAVNNPFSSDKTRELKVVGLFDVVADKTDEKNNYNEASYYDYSNYAFVSEAAMRKLLEGYSDVGYESADFFVEDPKQLETVIQKVQMLSSVNWDNFIISANDEVYERAAGSMSNVSTLIISLIVIVVIISIAVIILLLSMWMRSRQKEIGIFLAIGISKRSILIQYLFEVFLISLAAFPLAYLFSKGVAGGLGTLFGKTMDSVIVTPGYLAVTAGVGTAILAVSVLISCLPVMRYQPKEILARME